MEAIERLQANIGTQYTIERELGRGGMATVYLARDAKHQRSVALKVLHDDLAISLGAERFRREITTAARLQHPHILSVFDSGETTNSQLWFTMPYIEGESLRDRLRRDHQLAVPDAVRIAREIAGALGYAHAHGIVHRDIKPENVLLTTQGDALLADFGIARAMWDSTEGGGTALTETGVAPGTPQYMSPEQAAGETTLTARSDIYSLGAMLYEMLVGVPPFTGSSARAVVAQILTSDPPSVRARRPEVSPALDGAVRCALARAPADRFASADEMGHALTDAERSGARRRRQRSETRRNWAYAGVAAALMAAVLVGIGYWRGHGRLGTAASGIAAEGGSEASLMKLAVLPFDAEGDTADAYFADGITDEIRGKLSGLPALRLIASASSNQYRHTRKLQREIASELGVRYLLTGRVQWERATNGVRRVRVQPELIEVRDAGQPVIRWQSSYDTTLADVFEIQSAVATQVADKLGVVLNVPAQTLIEARPTRSLTAYDDFLRSAYVGIDPATLRRALASAEHAVALDSNYANAWARISLINSALFVVTVPTTALAQSSHRAAERAVALAPNAPAGYLARGMYAVRIANDRTAARAAYEKVLELEPSSAEAHQGLAGADAAMGDWSGALDNAQRAVSLDPRSAVAARNLSQVYLWLRRYPEARVAAERGLELAPGDLDQIEVRAMSRLGDGDVAGARAALRDVPTTLDRASLAAYTSTYWDLYWVLDAADRDLVLTLTPSAYDNDRGAWSLVQMALAGLRGDSARARAFADSAKIAFAARPASPADFQVHLFRGLALAGRGEKAAAEAEGVRGAAIADSTGDNFGSIAYAHHVLARLYVATGNFPKAVDELQLVLAKPYFISRKWLRVDPTWAPLEKDSRFQRLLAAADTTGR
jgi:eukaryotic-like serine/threonine-protein kinase